MVIGTRVHHRQRDRQRHQRDASGHRRRGQQQVVPGVVGDGREGAAHGADDRQDGSGWWEPALERTLYGALLGAFHGFDGGGDGVQVGVGFGQRAGGALLVSAGPFPQLP
ncbi:hypothetical protein [Actinomadura montaniterrae]|uniref:Uncharacterized protein n=1 Tax=Actinomadura montaniterrae TaxID=1803903 RepID=A0A6L3VX53_9ACTN|nr:hypothetical protein [Actinomadura montaniterrae]KAB2384718.1 hypothetical protein F9B16_09735 [Actinomadura montaniterrae]